MEVISDKMFRRPERPIRVMQFGEGVFMRGFADWILQDLDVKNAIDAGVVCVQPREGTGIASLAAQDGLYTLRLEGIDGRYNVKWSRVIDVIQDCIDPYVEYERFLGYGESEDLQIVISNTTECGIIFDEKDVNAQSCPTSFPGKLLALLERRYKKFEGKKHGLAIIPCENIYDNGEVLRDCLVKLAKARKMDDAFLKWLTEENRFVSSVADRIVAGYPGDEIESIQNQTGYIDNCAVKGEYYHLWAIERDDFVQEVFPADKTGLNVRFVDDLKPYQTKKERMLCGVQTALSPVALACGMDTVGGAMADPATAKFADEIVFNEAGYTIDAPQEEVKAYAKDVMERLGNPSLRHNLKDIAAYSTTKFETRLVPVIKDYVGARDELPRYTVFSLAALATYCRGKIGKEKIALCEEEKISTKWSDIWSEFDKKWDELAKAVLSCKDMWGEDLGKIHVDFKKTLAGDLKAIYEKGMKVALEDLENE